MYDFIKIDNEIAISIRSLSNRSLVLIIRDNTILFGPVLNELIENTTEICDELMLIMDISGDSIKALANNDKMMYPFIYGDINSINMLDFMSLFDPDDENDKRLLRIMSHTMLKKYIR